MLKGASCDIQLIRQNMLLCTELGGSDITAPSCSFFIGWASHHFNAGESPLLPPCELPAAHTVSIHKKWQQMDTT